MRHRARGQRIVANNLPLDANYIGPGCATFLIVTRLVLEPVVKLRLAALELREIVSRGQLLRSRNAVGVYFPHGAFVLIKRVNPGLSPGGASSIAVNRLNCSSSKWK